MHIEDDTICKEILLQSYQQAIEEGHLEMSLKPALDRFNEVRGVVTTYSCEGHPERDVFHAVVHLAVSDVKWAKMQARIEELLPPTGGIASIEFHYGSGEDEIQRHVCVRTHPMLVKENAVLPLIALANRLDKLTQRGFELGELVVMSAKRYPEDWPRQCAVCGSSDIKVVYSEVAGIKRPCYVECFACQLEAQATDRQQNFCPACYSCMNFDGRGGNYRLQPLSDSTSKYECPNCKCVYTKGPKGPVPVVLLVD